MPYYQFKNEDGQLYGSFEVFYAEPLHGAGWFWHTCFPGCLPETEAFGPFATEQEAVDDAQDGA